MESFVFNGVSSIGLGLIIKEMPPIIRATKNIESIKVNGRNGNVHIDNGTYDSINITINCIVKELIKIDTIKSALQGTGELRLSTIPGRIFKATIKNQIDFAKYLRVLREFPLQLELDPFSYSEEETLTFTSNSIFNINGNVETYPTLTITGVGTITINNITVEVLETGITIDCELMECTKNNLNKNSNVLLDEFPKLNPDSNTLTLGAGISQVVITYKERWL